jgi:outer membrane protein TolC
MGAFAGTPISSAETRELSEAEVVAFSMQHNPDLASAMLSEQQAAVAVRAEEARYPVNLQANAGYTRSASPSLGPNGTVVTGTRESFSVGSTVSKDFATGTSVSLSVQGERSTTTRAVGALVTSGSAGTGYSLSTRLSVAQPLLRGAGTRIGEAELRNARLSQSAQKEARGRVTSEVLRDVLSAYWELWYASRAVGIEVAARKLTEAERNEAKARNEKGGLANVDLLAFETRLATQDEQVTTAELTEIERGLALAQVLGADVSSIRLRATGEPKEPHIPSVGEVEEKLAKQSPELKELEAKLELAESRAKVAGDAYRPRLDVEGYVELRGLGNGSPGPAFAQVGTLGAVGGYVGMVFETPLGGGRESIEIENARIAVRLAKNQLDAARTRIRANAAQLVAQLEAARARTAAAEQTAGIAAKQLEAEQARFAAGASTPIQVQTAEDSLRQARLRVVRARVDAIKTGISLEHSTGDLVPRYGATVQIASP